MACRAQDSTRFVAEVDAEYKVAVRLGEPKHALEDVFNELVIRGLSNEVQARRNFAFWLGLNGWQMRGLSNVRYSNNTSTLSGSTPLACNPTVESDLTVVNMKTRVQLQLEFLTVIVDGDPICDLMAIWQGEGREQHVFHPYEGHPIL